MVPVIGRRQRNSAEDYRAAWTRMHALVSPAADNVEFVVAPNAETESTRAFTDCYPRFGLIDHLGLDGQKLATARTSLAAGRLFTAKLAAPTAWAPMIGPILITEVA